MKVTKDNGPKGCHKEVPMSQEALKEGRWVQLGLRILDLALNLFWVGNADFGVSHQELNS
jgi:hypothetical protein